MCLNVTECEKDLKIALMFCIKLGVKMKPECWDAAGSRGSVIMWTQEQETGHWMSTSDIPKGTLDAARHRRDKHQRRSSNIQERERNEVGHSRIDTHTCNPSPPLHLSLSHTHCTSLMTEHTHQLLSPRAPADPSQRKQETLNRRAEKTGIFPHERRTGEQSWGCRAVYSVFCLTELWSTRPSGVLRKLILCDWKSCFFGSTTNEEWIPRRLRSGRGVWMQEHEGERQQGTSRWVQERPGVLLQSRSSQCEIEARRVYWFLLFEDASLAPAVGSCCTELLVLHCWWHVMYSCIVVVVDVFRVRYYRCVC